MSELYHHGVQGQKWGVRNAEWYPIDAWKKSLENGRTVKEKVKILKDEAAKHRLAKETEKADRLAAKEKQRKAIAAQKERQRKIIDARNKEKEDAKNEKIAEKERLKAEELANLKKDILERGDLKAAKANIKNFSNEELQQVITRYSEMTKFNKYVDNPNKKPTLEEKITDKIDNATQNLNNKAQQMNQQNQNRTPEQKKEDVLSKVEKVVSTGKRIGNIMGDVSNIASKATQLAGSYSDVAKLINANGGNLPVINIPKKEEIGSISEAYNVYSNGIKELTQRTTKSGNKTIIEKMMGEKQEGTSNNKSESKSESKEKTKAEPKTESKASIVNEPVLALTTTKNEKVDSFLSSMEEREIEDFLKKRKSNWDY